MSEDANSKRLIRDDKMKNGSSLWSRRGVSLGGFFLVFLMITACGGDGCDMDGFRDAPYPLEHVDKTVPVSAEVRVTSHGLDFMSGQVDNIIGEFAEDGLSFCIPPTETSGMELCHTETTCNGGDTGCQLDLEITEAELIPSPSDRLVVDIVIDGLLADLPVDGPLGLTCWLHLYSTSGGTGEAASISASVPVKFEPDELSPFRDLRFEVEEMVADITDVDYHLSNRSGLGCGAASFGIQAFLDGFLRDMILEELEEIVDDINRAELCRTCEDDDLPCPSNATCDESDDPPVCIYDDNARCVPRFLGIEGMLEPGELLGDFVGAAADVHMTGRLADRGVADTGLTLGARVGTEPEHYTSCAPIDLTTRPSFEEIAPSPSINADVTPEGDAFMFGFALHRRTLDHIMWSLWASGSLCLEVGSEEVDMLSTGSIGALVPAINQVALENGPMKIILSPQLAPEIKLGANRVVTNGNVQTVEEGLIILDWKDLDIHMYGYVLERYARLFTIRVDLELPVAVLPDGEDGIYPVLGDIEDGLQNMRILNDDMLDADTDRLLELLPTLLGFALPELAGALSDPIELPQFLGYQLVIGPDDLRGIDNNQYLGLFANLEFVGYDPNEMSRSLRALVQDHSLDVEKEGRFIPRVGLNLDMAAVQAGQMMAADEVQFTYRLNGGTWHLAGAGQHLRINDPRLSVQGIHKLELRGRTIEEGTRWQRIPTELEVIVDYEPPVVEAWQDENFVQVRAEDVVDSTEDLELRHRLILDGEAQAWSSWDSLEAIAVGDGVVSQRMVVEVEVRDRSGNTASEEVSVRHQAMGAGEAEAGDEMPRGCAGCTSTGQSGTMWSFVLLALGLFVLRMRRRLKPAAALVGLLVMGLTTGCGGCGDDPAATSCSEECSEFQTCDDGQCVDIGCDDDAECETGICENGTCVDGCRDVSECELTCDGESRAFCTDNECVCEELCPGGCGTTGFCCHPENTCQDFPDWCEDQECDPGFEPEITHIGDHDNEKCEVTGGSCECVSLPPLPLRYHGAYPSMAEGAGIRAVSVYNMHYRDLMVGILDESFEPDWYFVDGVPRRGQVQGAIDGPRGGLTNTGDRVGTHTATAVDDNGRIHVFYRDDDEDALKYGRGDQAGGEWTFETAYVEEEDGDTAYFSSVLLVGETLHLFYTTRLEDDESEIRYRAIDIDHPLDAMGETEYAVLHSGSRSVEAAEDYPPVVGLYLQAVAMDDEIFVSFYDNTIERAGWLISDGEEWNEPEFFEEPVGPYTSARPGPTGEIHIAYMEAWPPAVAYQVVGGEREEIASGVRHTVGGTSQTAIGHDVQLHVYGSGRVEVLFHDASTHELIRAVKDDDWEVETLDGEAGVRSAAHGLFVRGLSLAEGGRLIMDFGIDTTGEERIGKPFFRKID